MSRPRSKSPSRPPRRRKTRAARGGMDYYPPPFFVGSIRPSHRLRRRRESSRKGLIGEVAERSKALDWNSSNILTGIRGFESHPLRQMVARIGFSATTGREHRQARKGAAAA